jgi:hypothetical protein
MIDMKMYGHFQRDEMMYHMASFGCADKPTEKHCWLICCERKTLFWLKNKLKSTDYKPDEQDLVLIEVDDLRNYLQI